MMNYKRLRSDEIKSKLHTHLADVATIYAEPRYVFDECLSFLSRHRVALPPYTSLQKIVGKRNSRLTTPSRVNIGQASPRENKNATGCATDA